jgi:hypothetical protein
MITDEDADITSYAPETKADALAALNNRNAVFLGIVDPTRGTTTSDYGPDAGSLAAATGGQTFDIVNFRADAQPVLTAIINTCITVIQQQAATPTPTAIATPTAIPSPTITLDPKTDSNEVGTSHTVTATVTGAAAGTQVTFEITTGPNSGDTGTGTTDASGKATFAYTGDGAWSPGLIEAARGADLLIAHLAIPEDAGPVARQLHATPSTIGHIAAAAAWGLFPEWDAMYLNYNGQHDTESCYRATYGVPDNKGFWSITVYGADGYLKTENAVLNASNVTLNDDGTFTAYFGSRAQCGEVPNRLDVTSGWNFLMRIYLPGTSVLDGSYKLPEAERYGLD